MPDFGVVRLEGDDQVKANGAVAASQASFDLWFTQEVKEGTGIDFSLPLPSIEQLMDLCL